MSKTISNILVIGVGIALLAGGYYLFFAKSAFELEGAAGPLDDQILLATQSFIEHRQTLSAVTLNTGIFSDPRFTTLRSNATPIITQSVGKDSLFDGSQSAAAISAATGQ